MLEEDTRDMRTAMKAADEHVAKLSHRVRIISTGQTGRLMKVRCSIDATPARGWKAAESALIDLDVWLDEAGAHGMPMYERWLKPSQIEYL